jgi:hypothetical protein
MTDAAAIEVTANTVTRHREVLTDPGVVRTKFDREVAHYRLLSAEYLKRGWILLSADFPTVIVLFAAAHLKPSAMLYGVAIDFWNYDFWPPSVTFIDAFTLQPLTVDQLPNRLPKKATAVQMPGLPPGMIVERQPDLLVQAHEDKKPFLCMKGVREYHDHPQHSNDPWLPLRTGSGSLYHILDVIYRHGIRSIPAYSILMQVAPAPVNRESMAT